MRTLITGSGGFVGRHLIEHLRTEGDDVVGVDVSSGVDVTDPDAVRRAVGDARPDVIYHLAALSHIGESFADPAEVLRVNAGGTLTVLRAAVDLGVERVLVVASADAYGVHDGPIDEDVPLRPVTPYGASKAAADLLALQTWLGDGLATIRVRAFNHTGPGQPDRFVVPALARRIAKAESDGSTELRVGNLDAERDFLDVRDVVAAYRLLAVHGDSGAAYNVCSGVARTVRSIAERLVAMSNGDPELVIDPDLVRPVEVPRMVGNPGRLAATTSFAPRFSFDDTLRAVLDEARAAAGGTPPEGVVRP
ncbi:MAG: GDP-mannose 4,6-dehydratase [Acidimicrobiia bacterium]|nr:GDP-mannose 4,6-dehydratase [Acidimicrobiia bacterium]